MKRRAKFWRYILTAEVLTTIGFANMARKLLEKSLKNVLGTDEPHRLAAVYAAQASVEERCGDIAKASALLEKAIEVAPVDEVSLRHFDLAVLQEKQRNYQAAVSHLSMALHLLDSSVSQECREDIQTKLNECREKVSSPPVL